MKLKITIALLSAFAALPSVAVAQDETLSRTLFTNVNVFDGFADELAMNTDVWIEGNHIIEVGQSILSSVFTNNNQELGVVTDD